MKTCIYLAFALLLATSLYAETYSWVDDSGTYNYTEDYSSVPKKYQKKVKRREDIQQDVMPAVSPDLEIKTGQTETADVKPTAVPGGEKELYGGKSRDAWRKEMEALEAELHGIAQHMNLLNKQIQDTPYSTKAQFDMLKKEYDDSRATYDQKYKNYTGLIETIRKAGIAVEIKK
ncbi:MAG: DUF4124 domain-containing protein [Desulfuromonadaceae bacterium]|nr:DUF4124 domain-containing protein [Desulfuromonadaceae bacterium]